MANKEELLAQLEEARKEFLALINTIPESDYGKPSGNDAWTVGDVLYHITLGPKALALETWMIIHARGLFQFVMNIFPSRTFNRVNAWFGRRDTRRLTRSGLASSYEKGHAALRSVLRRVREEDLAKAVTYPAEFVSELAGQVTLARLAHYAKEHVEVHAGQIHAG